MYDACQKCNHIYIRTGLSFLINSNSLIIHTTRSVPDFSKLIPNRFVPMRSLFAGVSRLL